METEGLDEPQICPFCGSDTEIETTTFGDNMTDYYRINCKQKSHSLDWWEEDKNTAIAVWNERWMKHNK